MHFYVLYKFTSEFDEHYFKKLVFYPLLLAHSVRRRPLGMRRTEIETIDFYFTKIRFLFSSSSALSHLCVGSVPCGPYSSTHFCFWYSRLSQPPSPYRCSNNLSISSSVFRSYVSPAVPFPWSSYKHCPLPFSLHIRTISVSPISHLALLCSTFDGPPRFLSCPFSSAHHPSAHPSISILPNPSTPPKSARTCKRNETTLT